MNVAQWLDAIDLGEVLFREHEIDTDVLPDLVEADGLASALFQIPCYVGRKTEAIAPRPPAFALRGH